jgi:hypothetical protein
MRRIWAVTAIVVMSFAVGPSTVAAQSSTAEQAWTAVTATQTCKGPTGGTQEMDKPPYWVRDWTFRCVAAASDTRVSGSVTQSLNVDTWDPTFTLAIAWWDVTLEGPDGVWSGRSYGVWDSDNVLHAVTVLAGNGAYQDLVYAYSGTEVAGSGHYDLVGLIQPGSVPPAFETPTASPVG